MSFIVISRRPSSESHNSTIVVRQGQVPIMLTCEAQQFSRSQTEELLNIFSISIRRPWAQGIYHFPFLMTEVQEIVSVRESGKASYTT